MTCNHMVGNRHILRPRVRKFPGLPMKEMDPSRVQRMVGVMLLAESVFEDQRYAAQWLLTPNPVLGDAIPAFHCDTESDARRVRQILRSIEHGGVV